MATGGYGAALRQVRRLFEAGAVGGLTDRQLLERFRAGDGEAAEWAFAVLVERHGPMVLRVCRRTLRDTHDAQDAFQATFLVLVRKAGTLRAHDSLGPWLHAVARRVAACARAAEARRRAHERKAAEEARLPAGVGSCVWDDLGQVLHEEIDRLPGTYRAAVVLCDLEGLTQEQAAQRLGWPAGTVRSRLARGRGRLQARLLRRGLAPSAGALAALLDAEAATAGVPAALVEAACRTATLLAAGQVTAGAVSAAALMEGAMRAMLMTRLKLISVALLAISSGAGGTAVLALHQAASQPEPPAIVSTSAGEPRRPGTAGAERPPGTSPRGLGEAVVDEEVASPGIADEGERAIARAELDRKRAEERLAWSNRMYEKGYISRAQNIEDKLALEQATRALERMRAEIKGQANLPGVRPADERKSDEIRILEKEMVRVEAEMQTALIRAAQAREMEARKLLLRIKNPGELSDAECKLAEAQVDAALADGKVKQAELKLLELRLSRAKR
jgi:RNA polymerase sigma factor (sigma-70 family)